MSYDKYDATASQREYINDLVHQLAQREGRTEVEIRDDLGLLIDTPQGRKQAPISKRYASYVIKEANRKLRAKRARL